MRTQRGSQKRIEDGLTTIFLGHHETGEPSATRAGQAAHNLLILAGRAANDVNQGALEKTELRVR